jgi:hypothetical protein
MPKMNRHVGVVKSQRKTIENGAKSTKLRERLVAVLRSSTRRPLSTGVRLRRGWGEVRRESSGKQDIDGEQSNIRAAR